MALGELYYGSGKGVRNLICISIGTGIGGGIVLDGKLYSGEYGFAAEIAHLIVEPDGLECDCGQYGCLERYSSTMPGKLGPDAGVIGATVYALQQFASTRGERQ